MLKETPTSLRAYFGLIALFSLLPVAAQLSEGKFDVASALIGLIFGGLYSYVAVRIDHLLSQRPGFIRGVLILNLVLSGLAAAVGILNGNGLKGLPFVVLAFVITAYLYTSVGRLSRGAFGKIPEKPGPPPTPPSVAPPAGQEPRQP